MKTKMKEILRFLRKYAFLLWMTSVATFLGAVMLALLIHNVLFGTFVGILYGYFIGSLFTFLKGKMNVRKGNGS